MSEDNKALKALLDGISLMIDEKLKLAGFDRSVIGFITGANLENNTYTVQINGYEYVNVKSVIGNLGTMTPCICTIPQNQMSQMYISGIVDNTNYIDGGGGGTGGNYNDLQNKPSINGVTLSGNKTTSDLGISQPTKTSQLTNDSNFVVDANYVHTDNNFTNALLSKLNGIEDGADVNLIEKITVNGVEQTISSKTVALTVMTNAVNDLVNYYTKSETYTKTEVNGLISAIPKFAIEVVNSLPTTDISTTTIYLLRNSETTGSDLFEEYIYVNNAWELLGAQTIDLSNYVTTSDLNTALASYVTSASLATTLLGYVTTTTWNTLGAVATSNDYNDLNNKPTIPTVYDGTLTLKLNGVTAGSFSANQSQNEEIDLIVGGGGHVIQDADGTDLTQRDTLQFGGYLQATDDSTNDKTVVSDEPTKVTWSAWQNMTDAQKEGTKWIITDIPSVDGTLSADLLTKLWENPSPTSSFSAQDITLSSSDYDFLLVLSRFDTGGNTVANSIIVEKTNSAFVISYNYQGTSSYSRTCGITSSTTISCDNAYAGGQVTNTTCIPIVIYGIKKTINLTFSAVAENVSTLASKCEYDNTDSGMTAENVQDAIDELNSDIAYMQEYVEYNVPANSGKTWAQILAAVEALLDMSKITTKSTLTINASVLHLVIIDATRLIYAQTYEPTATKLTSDSFDIKGHVRYYTSIEGTAIAHGNQSSQIPTSSINIRVYY